MATKSFKDKAKAFWLYYCKKTVESAPTLFNIIDVIIVVTAFEAGYLNGGLHGEVAALALLIIMLVVVKVSRKFFSQVLSVGGDDVPTPAERFTDVDEDGMVSVRNERIQELLLYVSEVEDYLERKGRL